MYLLFKAIVHRLDKPNHDFPEMISASIGSGLFVSGITLVMIFDFPNYCASHHINISGDRCHQCHQLVSPVSPVGVTSSTGDTGDTLLRHDFGKKFKSPHTKNLNSSRISIVGMPSHQVVYLTRSEVQNISLGKKVFFPKPCQAYQMYYSSLFRITSSHQKPKNIR